MKKPTSTPIAIYGFATGVNATMATVRWVGDQTANAIVWTITTAVWLACTVFWIAYIYPHRMDAWRMTEAFRRGVGRV